MPLHQCLTLRRAGKMISTFNVFSKKLPLYLFNLNSSPCCCCLGDLHAALLFKVATTRSAWLCSGTHLHTDYFIIFTLLNPSGAPAQHAVHHGGSLRLWELPRLLIMDEDGTDLNCFEGCLFIRMDLLSAFRQLQLNIQSSRFINF